MKKIKKPLGLGLLLVSATCLSSCGGKKNPTFWTCFGSEYTTMILNLVDMVKADFDFNIEPEDHKSYDTILTNIQDVTGSGDYPNVCLGYPDHFITYEASGILVDLTDYITAYDQAHGTNILRKGEDQSATDTADGGYYDAYMKENRKIIYDADGNGRVNALPFNKSTEVMAYNSVFVDFCEWWCGQNPDVEVNGKKASEWDIGQDGIPNTWQKWAEKGPYYRHVLDQVIGDETKVGKFIYGKQDANGRAHDFEVKDAKANVAGKVLLLDFPKVEKEKTRVMGWDATDNMFITLIKQWGSHYTRLQDNPEEEEAGYRQGFIDFISSNDKAKTLECLKFFAELSDKKIIGTPNDMVNESFCTKAFQNNQVMFTICSSGGVHKNIDGDTNPNKRMAVRAIPYYDDGTTQRRIVISQGANIAMLDKGTEEQKQKAFEFMVKITSGKYQAKWCLDTGYFPCSVSAANDPSYKALFEGAKDYEDKKSLSHREASEVNKDIYMNASKPWEKFVDDPFDGSAKVREAMKDIMQTVFHTGLEKLHQGDAQFNAYCTELLTNKANTLKNGSAKHTIQITD